MDKDIDKIVSFINKHHVLSLATYNVDEISVCSLFYVFDSKELSFIVSSSDETNHIQHIKKNKNVAGNILLETNIIDKIQGVQFKGFFHKLHNKKLKKIYFKRFPYAKLIKSNLWQIKVNYFKMTDNKLGFGKKIIYSF